jgi:hypothetical protein
LVRCCTFRSRRIVFTNPSIEGDRYEEVVLKLILPAEVMRMLATLAAGTTEGTISAELIALQPGVAN